MEDTMQPELDHQKIFRKERLKFIRNCVERLLDLLDKDAPSVIIDNELSLITYAAVQMNGGKVFESLGRAIQSEMKQYEGICTSEDCWHRIPNGPNDPKVNICNVCYAEAQADAQAAEEEEKSSLKLLRLIMQDDE
jgi:hypothetical protein